VLRAMANVAGRAVTMSDSADSGNRGNGLAVAALAQRIHLIRGHKVMLDADLAELYGAPTKALNQAVKRNAERFPPDFMFRLSAPCSVKAQGAKRRPPRAVEMSVFVVRAFVQLREFLATHRELAAKLDELERKLSTHDQAIAGLIDAIRQLTATPPHKARPIGFTADLNKKD